MRSRSANPKDRRTTLPYPATRTDLQNLIPLVVGWLCLSGLIAFEALKPVQAVSGFDHAPELQNTLQQALKNKPLAYRPRTEHLHPNGEPVYLNRLILEDSPYLLQHAHNPVDWFPWGQEAFAKAQRENKPIFLSIGYSTCHWCHVMEKESFENERIAEFLNEFFVPIKVDRELHPGVDANYMTAVRLLTGGGGWPMSSFLTPQGKTFYAGTYFTPERFQELLLRVHDLWLDETEALMQQAERVAEAVSTANSNRQQAERLRQDVVQQAVQTLLENYDELEGGFSDAPKFPNETYLFLLLNEAERNPSPKLLEALEFTLLSMAYGGIYDQLGGGFHRYATDPAWQVPHFEKMLYNQAHLSRIYTQAWVLTGNPELKQVATETLDFVLRAMSAPEGGFYSAYDADSEGEEGVFYTWTPAQIRALLNESDADFILDFYSMSEFGNFEGANILHRTQSLSDYAKGHKKDFSELQQRLLRLKLKLRQQRALRPPPLRDDKKVTAWNGMMISAFAYAGDVFERSDYLKAAIKAADHVWAFNRNEQGQLQRSNLHGRASVAATQNDYAYLAEAALQLYDSTADQQWLNKARELTDTMLSQFWDAENGGLFLSLEDGLSQAMGRHKDRYDGAIPSGNSVALQVLQKLSRRTLELEYPQKLRDQLAAFSASVQNNPTAYAYFLTAANDYFNGETAARQFAAKGAVAVTALLSGDNLQLSLNMAPGWHINAQQPNQNYLIPTKLTLNAESPGWHLSRLQYPAAQQQVLGFEEEPLALYTGQVQINARLKQQHKDIRSTLSPQLELQLQACSEQVCLAPETLKLRPLLRRLTAE